MQDGNVSPRVQWIVSIVRPRICFIAFWMPLQVEYLDHSIPYCLPLEGLFHWNALRMFGLRSVQALDDVLQLLDVWWLAHDASTKFFTVQKSFSIPAAIAGVQRSVL